MVALLSLSVGSAVKADVVDPKIALGPTGSCVSTENNPLQETSLTQSFTGLQTGCINDFQNEIGGGVTLDKLVVNITSPFTGTISCALTLPAPLNDFKVSSPTSCTFFEHSEGGGTDDESTGDVQCQNSESEDCGGIGHGTIYGLSFDKNFGDTVDITLAQKVMTPEPTTLLLFGSGFVTFLANKKRLKGRKHSL
jgi:hypothetical protein